MDNKFPILTTKDFASLLQVATNEPVAMDQESITNLEVIFRLIKRKDGQKGWDLTPKGMEVAKSMLAIGLVLTRPDDWSINVRLT